MVQIIMIYTSDISSFCSALSFGAKTVKKSDPDSFDSNPEEWRASLNFESSESLLIISSRFLVGLGPLTMLKSLF